MQAFDPSMVTPGGMPRAIAYLCKIERIKGPLGLELVPGVIELSKGLELRLRELAAQREQEADEVNKPTKLRSGSRRG